MLYKLGMIDMKHTYTEEEKEMIAQRVFDWLREYNYSSSCDIERDIEDNVIDSYADDLLCSLADIKDVTEE